jgi:hypothetical protein
MYTIVTQSLQLQDHPVHIYCPDDIEVVRNYSGEHEVEWLTFLQKFLSENRSAQNCPISLDMRYSVYFHKVLINTPTNALILLYND